MLRFDQFARELDVTLGADDALDGTYGRIGAAGPGAPVRVDAPARHGARSYRIHAERAIQSAAPPANAPSIGGLWLVPAQSRKYDEKAWRFVVRQSDAEVSAAILRVDGDTGTLSGRWNGSGWLLSNFSGTRAELLQVTPAADGTLRLQVQEGRGVSTYIAYRPADAVARGLPGAADAAHHTSVRDPNEVFRFSGQDLQGRQVSNRDRRFAGKVVLVDIAGSWCPNCHDEAPFLQSLYRRYHRRGLVIVALDFEEPDQLQNPARLRAFIRAYHLTYTVLLDGTPDQVRAKLPQAMNLDAWPTTFFVGRDGRVKSVHTGFAARASGRYNIELEREYRSEIERLLAGREPH